MSSREMQLVETAKEELDILHSQYPNRFAYLKSDLHSFISNLRQDHAPLHPSSSSVVLTQESSNCKTKQKDKKRKYTKEGFGDEASMGKKRKDRVEKVLQRAQLCLQKIRDVKASLR